MTLTQRSVTDARSSGVIDDQDEQEPELAAESRVASHTGHWQLRWQRTVRALDSLYAQARNSVSEQIRALFQRRVAAVPQLLFIGDSLTQRGLQVAAENDPNAIGWGIRLVQEYNGVADCIFRGLSGYNTRWALPLIRRFLADLPAEHLLLVGIWFGANDAASVGAAQYVPLDEYASNLYEIMKLILERSHDGAQMPVCLDRRHRADEPMPAVSTTSADSTETTPKRYPYILLMTPPWVDESARMRAASTGRAAPTPTSQDTGSTTTNIRLEPDRQNVRTSKYAQACHRVAAQIRPRERVLLLDLHERIQGLPPNERSTLYNDGLHLSARGQEFVFQAIRQLLAEEAPALTPSSLGQYAIPWRDINPSRPREQLAIYE
ncbi:hypothetical protein F1559_003580 [Cyanidiococcus yangmingshanensis]|uniref:SGNH hydrolase-type esterase domain-containing protein n=1 Tax=Cyanidiococcus yangmingshanensis TaxID=2690220 RepID=A0A7J7IDG8_9RHOD|nr:hypothetical protein F1559_003580 [Cyanidiococcus yangmingshanensis]